MRVIAIVAQKGGTGKTTLTVSLAVAAMQAGRSVVIVDLDPQATTSKWSDRREPNLRPSSPPSPRDCLSFSKRPGRPALTWYSSTHHRERSRPPSRPLRPQTSS